MSAESEFPWDHTDRFWGQGLHVACSRDDARSMIAALTEALLEVDAGDRGLDAGDRRDEPVTAWRSAIDAGGRGDTRPGLSVSVTDRADAPLDVSADMDRHAQVRDVIAAAVAGFDPNMADADPERLRTADRDRVRAAIVDAQLPPDQIVDVYRQATAAAEATRDHRWVEAGFRYEADHQRQADRDEALDASFGLAAEDSGRQSGRGWSL